MTTAAEFQAKTAKSVTNMDRLDVFTNGNDTATVTTDNGEVPSIAKLAKDFQTEATETLGEFGDAAALAASLQPITDDLALGAGSNIAKVAALDPADIAVVGDNADALALAADNMADIQAAPGAAAVATAARATVPKIYGSMGEDGRSVALSTAGSITPDSTTVGTGNIVCNIPAVPERGYINWAKVRLSLASGTAKWVIFNYQTNTIVRTVADVSYSTATPTFNAGAELGDSHFLEYFQVLAFKDLTGGRVRQATGTNGRAISAASWDGTDGDTVTVSSPGSTYAIEYELSKAPTGSTTKEKMTQRRKRGAEGLDGLFDVLECYFDQPGNIQTNLASPGINDINLAAATNPNVTKTGYGVKLRGGLVQTSSITVQTIVSMHRVDPDSPLAYIISGGTAANSGVTTTSVPTDETIHTTTAAGVCPIYRKSSNGSRAIILLSGGWMVLFRDLGTSHTSIFGFGGRHSHASADRVSEMDIGFVGASTLSFSDAQRATIADALARRYLDQGVRVFNRDCSEPVYGIALTGDSSVEGRGRLYNGNVAVTATTVQGSRDITVTTVSGGTLMPQMSMNLASIPATAIIESGPASGGAGVYRLTVAADSTAGAGKTGTASHFGVEFDDTLIMAGTSQTVFRDLQPLKLGENQQNEVPAALASTSNAGVAVGIARWRRANRLTRKKRVCVVTLTRGSSHICPFGAITAGSDPAPLFTYHPNAMEDSAAYGSANNRTLFDLFLEQWYRATAQARNRNIALQMDALAIPGGLQATIATAATGGSAAAFQGYMQAFLDAVKLYTGENPRPVVFQSQTGAGGDPTLIGYIRDGQLAFKNANSGAVLYDTDISVPSSVNYAGAPHGLNSGDFHLNLYSVLKQGEAVPAALGWV